MNSEDLTASGGGASDNLEKIEGIGPGYANALNSIGVFTYEDLFDYDTADELRQALLEQADTDVPLWKIEKGEWFAQAKTFAAARATTSKRQSPAREAEVTPTAHAENGARNWRRSSEFSVFFDSVADENGTEVWQTRAYHEESGDVVQFSGTELSSWANWILDQAGLSVAVDDELVQVSDEALDVKAETANQTETEITAVVPLEETRLDIEDIWISELGPSSDVPEKQLQAEVRFRISGDQAEEIVAKEPAYRIELHTIETELGASTLVASGRGQLRPHALEQTRRQAFPMPQVGRYRLFCIILFLPPGELAGYLEGPVFNVVQS